MKVVALQIKEVYWSRVDSMVSRVSNSPRSSESKVTSVDKGSSPQIW